MTTGDFKIIKMMAQSQKKTSEEPKMKNYELLAPQTFKEKFKYWLVGLVWRYIAPSNLGFVPSSNSYLIKERDKYFGIPYGYFWHAVAVGYLLKLIKFITKRTKE